MENLIMNLKKSILFRNKTTEELESLISRVSYKIIDLNKKDIVFSNFNNTNSIGLVLSGELTVERILPCGKVIVVFHKIRGELFGEVAVFSDAKEYPCNVVAQKNCSIILFSRDNFFKLITLDNDILQNFLNLISNKALHLNSKLELLSFSSVKQKIAYSLIRDFNACNNNDIVKLPFSKKIWADNLNISRSSLYRELDYLSNELIISTYESKLIKILDIDKLNKILLD